MKILDFYQYIYDRQALAQRKNRFSNNPDVWTKNPILKQYRFCNVRRYDDAGTQHLVKNVLEKKALNPDDILFNIIMYRFFNVRNFFTEILGTPIVARRFNFEYLEEQLDDAVDAGHKLFSNAYMICGIPYAKYRKEDKHIQILLRMENISINPDFYMLQKVSNVYDFMDSIKMNGRYLIGDFLAYQILLDWSYYKRIDGIGSFDYCGPGVYKTLEGLYKEKMTPKNIGKFLRSLHSVQKESFDILKKSGKDWSNVCGKNKEISITDIENCCCEFRKYFQYKTGYKGKVRRYAVPNAS